MEHPTCGVLESLETYHSSNGLEDQPHGYNFAQEKEEPFAWDILKEHIQQSI
jgi:hypothetical protein